MAGILFQEVKKHSRATCNARALLLILADYASFPDGRCFPKEATLAADMNMSVRQVKRCVRRLEELGELKVIRAKGKQNVYIVPRLAGAPVREENAQEPADQPDDLLWTDFWYWLKLRGIGIGSQEDWQTHTDDFQANHETYAAEIRAARAQDETEAKREAESLSPAPRRRGRPRAKGGSA